MMATNASKLRRQVRYISPAIRALIRLTTAKKAE